MTKPRFRFLDQSLPDREADPQFWRDVETSERLGSAVKANTFLRDLCRAKAWDGARRDTAHEACAVLEASLLQDVLARGYRVFGPDLDAGLSGSTATDLRGASA